MCADQNAARLRDQANQIWTRASIARRYHTPVGSACEELRHSNNYFIFFYIINASLTVPGDSEESIQKPSDMIGKYESAAMQH